MTRRAGAVLGRAARADALLKRVQAQITDVRTRHPGFAGKTFAFDPVADGSQPNVINSAKDVSAAFLAQLGLTISPKVTALPDGPSGRALGRTHRLQRGAHARLPAHNQQGRHLPFCEVTALIDYY